MSRRLLAFAPLALALGACTEMPATADPAAPAGEAPVQAAGEGTPMPAGLTSEERLIWNSLTEEAKRDAAAFIANGGTLTQFVAV